MRRSLAYFERSLRHHRWVGLPSSALPSPCRPPRWTSKAARWTSHRGAAGGADPIRVLEALTPAACAAHLGAGGIGRVVFTDESGPVALPVNFIFTNGTVVFRTSEDMAQAITGTVAFEVDHIDEAMRAIRN